MGMSDSQFKAYVRSLLLSLRNLKREEDTDKHQERLDEIIESLQQNLED